MFRAVAEWWIEFSGFVLSEDLYVNPVESLDQVKLSCFDHVEEAFQEDFGYDGCQLSIFDSSDNLVFSEFFYSE